MSCPAKLEAERIAAANATGFTAVSLHMPFLKTNQNGETPALRGKR